MVDNKGQIPDFLVRALKTFVQALVPVFLADSAAIINHVVAWDFADWKGWLLPIILSAIAAGISAVWNLIIERVNGKAQARILASMTPETIEKLLNTIVDKLETNQQTDNKDELEEKE